MSYTTRLCVCVALLTLCGCASEKATPAGRRTNPPRSQPAGSTITGRAGTATAQGTTNDPSPGGNPQVDYINCGHAMAAAVTVVFAPPAATPKHTTVCLHPGATLTINLDSTRSNIPQQWSLPTTTPARGRLRLLSVRRHSGGWTARFRTDTPGTAAIRAQGTPMAGDPNGPPALGLLVTVHIKR